MHNNETHLLICTVPWSHVTMKWMAVFFVVCFFAWMLCIACGNSRAGKTVHMDELLTSRGQILSLTN